MENHPDVVIVDLKLDREDGLKVVQEVRKSEVECRLVVLTISSDYRDSRK